jgi:hypothetical protein
MTSGRMNPEKDWNISVWFSFNANLITHRNLPTYLRIHSVIIWTLSVQQTYYLRILGSDSWDSVTLPISGKALRKTTARLVRSFSWREFWVRIWCHNHGFPFTGCISDHDPVKRIKEVMFPEGSPSTSLKCWEIPCGDITALSATRNGPLVGGKIHFPTTRVYISTSQTM